MKTLFGFAAFGFLLLILGAWVDIEVLKVIGIFILPLAFLWGGFFKAGESLPLKITMLAIGGILLAVSLQLLIAGTYIGDLF